MIVVSENTPLLERLASLLRLGSSADSEEVERLQDEIKANLDFRLRESRSKASFLEQAIPQSFEKKASYRATYEALKHNYREALSIARECSELKKLMRERKKRENID